MSGKGWSVLRIYPYPLRNVSNAVKKDGEAEMMKCLRCGGSWYVILYWEGKSDFVVLCKDCNQVKRMNAKIVKKCRD